MLCGGSGAPCEGRLLHVSSSVNAETSCKTADRKEKYWDESPLEKLICENSESLCIKPFADKLVLGLLQFKVSWSAKLIQLPCSTSLRILQEDYVEDGANEK